MQLNILFVSAVLPYPLYSGGQVRIYNLLKILSVKHKITLFSFIRSPKEQQFVGNLGFCKSVHTVLRGHAWQARYIVPSILGSYPLLLSTYNNSMMRRALAQSLQMNRYDLIHIEPGYVWPSLPTSTLPLIVAEHNIEHAIYSDYSKNFSVRVARPFLSLDVAKLKRWERRIWKKAGHVVTVSQEDFNEVIQNKGTSSVSIVPNGVDTSLFRFRPHKTTHVGTPRILFVGNFSWVQNRDAVRFLIAGILPTVFAAFPKAIVRIVGKNIPPDLRSQLLEARCELLEKVEDITKQYAWADVLLAPIRIGGGTKFKILEAMATGVPVVTTEKGAMGLLATHGKDIVLADTIEDIVEALDIYTKDAVKRMSLVRNARKLIEKFYTWESIARKLDTVWTNSV